MGYSGRIQTVVSRACGKGIDALFVHSDSKDTPVWRERVIIK